MRRPNPRRWISLLACLAACSGEEVRDEMGPAPEDTEVVRAAVTPPPISGGTLLLVDEGRVAVAADPDRDLVHVVDLTQGTVLHTIELQPGDEPGRLVQDDAGIVHVVARRSGAVVDIRYSPGVVERRRPVCANPRGIAYDAPNDSLHVACAGGQLVTLPAGGGEPTRRIQVAPDLRDVLWTDEGLAVTRFRAAQVLLLDDKGAVTETQSLPVLHRLKSEDGETFDDRLHPNTAWRTVPTPDGGWLMLHQVSTERELFIARPGEDGGHGDDGFGDSGGGGEGGYSGGGAGSICTAVAHPVLTMGKEALSTRSSPLLLGAVLPVDAAISPNGERVAMAVAGSSERSHSPMGVAWVPTDRMTTDQDTGCETPQLVPVPEGQYTAVAIDGRGWIVAQGRAPARVVRVDPNDPEHPEVVELPGEAPADTGHDLFHLDAGGGLACATCHPEGGDDGQVWRFANIGPRHTPALAVGLEGTAPFHWEGDLLDMRALVDEVHTGRMGGEPMSDPRVDALEAYLYALPIPAPIRHRGESAVDRGAALFRDWACGECHAGEAMAGTRNVSLGFDYSLQIPPLRGIALHPPYMHDGRAPDLRAAVLDMLARTQPDRPTPADDEVDAMVAYLESL